jgi:predicted dehydrogenase
MVRVALVGAGSHSATQHAPALRMLAERHPGQVELTAVCDPVLAKAARVAEQYGFARHVQSLDALSGAALDGLVVVLPIPVMLQATPQYLRWRLPMVIEKPLGRNLSEAREIVAAVEASGVPVMVSLNRRFDPALRMALEWIGRERLCIRLVEGCMLRSHRAEPDFLWGTGVHLIDALCHVAGPLELQGAPQVITHGESACGRTALLRGESGVSVQLTILPCAGKVEETIRLIGDEFIAELKTGAVHPWSIEIWRNGKLALVDAAPSDEPEFISSGAYAEMEAFISALQMKTPLTPTPQQALASGLIASQLQECGAPNG